MKTSEGLIQFPIGRLGLYLKLIPETQGNHPEFSDTLEMPFSRTLSI